MGNDCEATYWHRANVDILFENCCITLSLVQCLVCFPIALMLSLGVCMYYKLLLALCNITAYL